MPQSAHANMRFLDALVPRMTACENMYCSSGEERTWVRSPCSSCSRCANDPPSPHQMPQHDSSQLLSTLLQHLHSVSSSFERDQVIAAQQQHRFSTLARQMCCPCQCLAPSGYLCICGGNEDRYILAHRRWLATHTPWMGLQLVT